MIMMHAAAGTKTKVMMFVKKSGRSGETVPFRNGTKIYDTVYDSSYFSVLVLEESVAFPPLFPAQAEVSSPAGHTRVSPIEAMSTSVRFCG